VKAAAGFQFREDARLIRAGQSFFWNYSAVLLFQRFAPARQPFSMTLIAYRPEYRIYLLVQHNQLTYERLEEMTLATELPHYLADIERAVSMVAPGFTVLSDLRRTLGPNVHLFPLFRRSRELLRDAGIGLMVEVHPVAPSTQQLMQQLREQSELPTRLFTDMAQAEAFLRGRRQPPFS
jgi:hypothetical protein